MKIGHAVVPELRVKHLQVGCPLDLTLVGYIPAQRYCELVLHLHLLKSNLYHRNEWFIVCDKFVDAFIENAVKPTVKVTTQDARPPSVPATENTSITQQSV